MTGREERLWKREITDGREGENDRVMRTKHGEAWNKGSDIGR